SSIAPRTAPSVATKRAASARAARAERSSSPEVLPEVADEPPAEVPAVLPAKLLASAGVAAREMPQAMKARVGVRRIVVGLGGSLLECAPCPRRLPIRS